MNKFYLTKKKTVLVLRLSGLLLASFFLKLYHILLKERTILFVTKKKIRSISLGPISQLFLILTAIWVGDLFVQSLRYDEVINTKSDEISKLKEINGHFEEEFSGMNEKLRKINDYLFLISGEDRTPVSAQDQDKDPSENFDKKDLTRSDKHTLQHIRDANYMMSNIHTLTGNRIKRIENAISLAGLNLKKIPSSKQSESFSKSKLREESSSDFGKGGPLVLASEYGANGAKFLSRDVSKKRQDTVQFVSKMNYLSTLEKVANRVPFARPIKNYYMSSGFGSRVDPITRRFAVHQGLDFVGPKNEKIISPSDGVVILAERFSDYGNAVIINHGFGITTRYGHLSSINVRKGQFVRKGDVIARQGNTGRSTGSHLHYEVRYKDTPLNPRKFLEAGRALSDDNKPHNHVQI